MKAPGVGGGADTDRNLLFAVLALQADLIDGKRFVQACTLWVAQKDRPIATLLVEQGWLDEEDCADVERLLARKLKRHQGDVHASLAEVAGPEVLASLAGIADAEVERSVAELVNVPQREGTAAAGVNRAGRNLLYEELGHGGMGVVRRGRDPDLGRDLAVKLLLPRWQGDAVLERRFVEEAQVGGQLQHPGTVPVYEMGRTGDGCPYFSMKLVKGQTLASLLTGRDSLAYELPRFLGIFEAVCQAVAYAHSKGVIHRDIKPGNVMVGSFGEVQVMDWGLAKVLRDEGADPERTTAGTVVRTVRSDSMAQGEGRTGVVGTLAYMAPEQARGEAVDERADVFGLGAVLCVILTGQPPYVGGDLLRRATEGDMGEALARLEGCGAEPELVALARDCLAARREERPRHAGEVARRLSAYLAGVQERLRAAELERAAAAARAEEAQKRQEAEARARAAAEAQACEARAKAAADPGTGRGAAGLAAARRWRRTVLAAAAATTPGRGGAAVGGGPGGAGQGCRPDAPGALAGDANAAGTDAQAAGRRDSRGRADPARAGPRRRRPGGRTGGGAPEERDRGRGSIRQGRGRPGVRQGVPPARGGDRGG